MKYMKYIADTNILLQRPSIINEYEVVIPSHVLREIEDLELKRRSDKQLQYEIRRLKRILDNDEAHVYIDMNDYKFTLNDNLDSQYVDNILLQVAIDNGYGMITNDRLLKEKCKLYDIEVIGVDDEKDNSYTGIKEIIIDLNNDKDNFLLESLYLNTLGYPFLEMVDNQYLIIWDKNKPTYNNEGVFKGYECIDTLKYSNNKFEKLKFKSVKNSFTGIIKPINVKQRLAFDLLQNDDITAKCLFGNFGVGKDYLMISHAIHAVKEGKFDKIVWVRNNIEVKDSNPIGFLPDGIESKLKPFLSPMADHLGGEYGLQEFMDKGQIEVQHLGFIRGRDIRNSIIYVTECQSNTNDHIQLLLGRVGEGSQIWLNGDLKQTDSDKFAVDNGVNALKKLKGEELYGQVTMDKIERSKTARLAELLDR